MADDAPLSHRQGPWALVVPPLKFDDADNMWAAWVEQYGRPVDDDIRIDRIHTSGGDRRRYFVRQGPRTNHGHPHAGWRPATQHQRSQRRPVADLL